MEKRRRQAHGPVLTATVVFARLSASARTEIGTP